MLWAANYTLAFIFLWYTNILFLHSMYMGTGDKVAHVAKHQPGGGLKFLTFGRSESKQMAGL